jgi:hypothetical protein
MTQPNPLLKSLLLRSLLLKSLPLKKSTSPLVRECQ